MLKDFKEYTIWDTVTPKAITSSTDATPIVITKASHGLVTGDRVIIYGHATNVAANGIFEVTRVGANEFSLQDINTHADVAGSGAGAGGATGLFVTAPKVPLVSDFKTAILSFYTASTATLTVKVAASIGKLNGDSPNFGGTVASTNPYTFVQIIDLDTGSAINGATGIVVAGTDFAKTYEINTNGVKFLTLIPTAWTQGSITAKLQLFNDL